MPPDDGPRLVPALERATFRAEAPVRKVVRSNRLNPLPYAGTISVFLLIVVVVTGVYITLVFGFGFEASHRSVETGVAVLTGVFALIVIFGSVQVGNGWAADGPQAGVDAPLIA